jgi:L-2,4-diaminobutyric acid acetyltransferase
LVTILVSIRIRHARFAKSGNHVLTNDLTSENVAPESRFRFRGPSPADGRALWRLAADVGLDLNSPYAYVLWGEYFADTSVVAISDSVGGDEDMVGFVTGFCPPRKADTLFVWQIGVAGRARRRGLGGRMLDELLDRTGARFVEATVTPDNEASAALFRSIGARHDAPVEETPLFAAELFPDGHEPEVRFRIGPLRRR